MTGFMAFRGPDAQRVWVDEVTGSIGFGHTLLRTTVEAEHEHQPFTLDGRTWIVADARVDARDELVAKLRPAADVTRGVPDVELILHAYNAWGEACVEHLIGDFAFAIWDQRRRKLFCARDHLGVKPFFYAHVGQTLIFSNTLDCIRRHPAVSDTLDDVAIGDFLLFGYRQEPTRSAFAAIRRMPGAHVGTWSARGCAFRRYWTLPIDAPVHFKQAGDYTSRFRELLNVAVSDRLRTKRVGVFMSGGLDSSALAATACGILRSRHADGDVRAYTSVASGFDRNERHYASLVSSHLGITAQFRDVNAECAGRGWTATRSHTPEPYVNPVGVTGDLEEYRAVSEFSRVCFYGEGPDNALKYEWKPYMRSALQRRQYWPLITGLVQHLAFHRRIPGLLAPWRAVHETLRADPWESSFPPWIEPEFERRLDLRARWHDYQAADGSSAHDARPRAHGSFSSTLWEDRFSTQDGGHTHAPVELRHPFLDLRLLRFMLSVPVVPWCRRKLILRRSMADVLPTAVLNRPKSPLTSDPVWEAARISGLPRLTADHRFGTYVDITKVPAAPGTKGDFRTLLPAFGLHYWLINLHQGDHRGAHT